MAGHVVLKIAIATVSLGLMSSVTFAAPKKKAGGGQTYRYTMNAMCLLKDSKVEPFNPTEKEISESDSSFIKKVPSTVSANDVNSKFRIASLTKILLTHWAIAELGPLYRFETKVHVSPSEKSKGCDLYFEGSNDPFMGKEMLSTVFTQLRENFKSKGICKNIDSISYDENFLVPFNEVTKRFVIQHRQDGDFRASNPLRFYGPNTTRKALQYFFKTQRILSVKQDGIGPTASSFEYQRYLAGTPHATFSFRSRPLYLMLREVNAFSFNVPPDIIFKKMGGIDAYARFIKKRLGYGPDQVDLVNGSGYPIISDGKTYNEVSCSAIVRTIQDLDNILRSYKGGRTFQLADVMAVGGTGEEFSTFKSLYGGSQFTNTMVAKTGSAEEAITFGGMLSTTEGDLYFAVLTRPESYVNNVTNSARLYVRDMMTVLADRYTLKKFDYTQQGMMAPIDADSQLVDIDSNYSRFEVTGPILKPKATPASTGKKAQAKVSNALP